MANGTPTITGPPKETQERTMPPNETALRSNSNLYNAATTELQLPQEVANSAYNHHLIVNAIKEGRAMDISKVPKVNGVPAIIVSSGPSLDDSMKYMKDWKGAIFCSTSHARTFIYHGREPDYIVILDPYCKWEEIEHVDWSKTKTKLITHPGAWPDLLEHWPNEMYLYRQDTGRNDSFFSREQMWMYSERHTEVRDPVYKNLIPTMMMIFACSPPLELFAAHFLGYGPFFTAGLDMCHLNGKSRFTEWIPDAEGNWTEKVVPEVPGEKDVIMSNGKTSVQVFAYYLKNFITAWRMISVPMWTTDHGAFTIAPYLDMKEVVKRQGRFKPWPKEKINLVCEQYLAKLGSYIIETSERLHPIESENPPIEVPKFMEMILAHFKCPKCAAIVRTNDGQSLLGKPCPRCQTPLIRAAEVDTIGNMKRIIELVEHANGGKPSKGTRADKRHG